MASSSSSSSTTTATTTIDDLHPDILALAFRRMDGPTLASAGSSSSLFRSLTADPSLWRELCFSAWPSLHLLPMFPLLSPSSFFADSFPFPDTEETISISNDSAKDHSGRNRALPKSLFSCVDIYHAGVPVFSRVVETETSCSWFLGSVFHMDALDRKDPPEPARQAPQVIAPSALELNWVVVDAETGRAVNVSSRRPVEVGRHWYTGETLVKFVTVLDRCAISILVTCGEEAGQLREVTMTVEDWDGITMSGKESLEILAAAMEGRRRGRGKRNEAKRRYEEYLRSKSMRKERKARREGMLDLCCTGFGAMVFLAFLMLLALRR